MLVLTRYEDESIQIGNDITIKVLEKSRRRTKLGFEAPRHIPVYRSEVTDRHNFSPGRAIAKPAAVAQ